MKIVRSNINELKVPFTPYHIRNKKKLASEEKETAERRAKEYADSEEGKAKAKQSAKEWKDKWDNGGKQKHEANIKKIQDRVKRGVQHGSGDNR